MSKEYGIRIWSNEIYNEKGTSNIRNGLFICNLSGKFHVREGNIPVCIKYNKSYRGNKAGGKRGEDSVDKSISYTSYQHGITAVYECVMQLITTKSK